jgi:hypothetical protein
VRGEKNTCQACQWFVYLLVNTEFYSHLASWQVVIRTPAINYVLDKKLKKKMLLYGVNRHQVKQK